MIKAGVIDGKEQEKLEMRGSLNELMNDFRSISKGVRGFLTDKFGKEDGIKIFNVLSSDMSDKDIVEEVSNIIDEHLEKEFEKYEPDGLLKAFMKMFGDKEV